MGDSPEVQPLPLRQRRYTFLFLVGLFVLSLPFLYLYATGYRFNLDTNLPFVSTGGLYVGSERAGAEIYIDDELVRETRTFRKAFYAQGLKPGTHHLHVQKPDHHTWVKELPVYPHLVTEAQAFNLPLVPDVRLISAWKNRAGVSILFASSTVVASSTNDFLIATTTATSSLIADTEFATLLGQFLATTTSTSTDSLTKIALEQLSSIFTATSSRSLNLDGSTTTKEVNNVRLSQKGDELVARFTGDHEGMPYYYCAEDFELLGTSTGSLGQTIPQDPNVAELIGPVQYVAKDVVCDPEIWINRRGQKITGFDFYPGSTDLVLIALHDGVYAVEIDDRAWQNVQPLILGEDLLMRIENGSVYVYDGELIYQVLIEN